MIAGMQSSKMTASTASFGDSIESSTTASSDMSFRRDKWRPVYVAAAVAVVSIPDVPDCVLIEDADTGSIRERNGCPDLVVRNLNSRKPGRRITVAQRCGRRYPVGFG